MKNPKQNERLQALQILTQVFQDQTPLSYLMQAEPSLSPLCKDICFGVCRHFLRLQAIADCFVKKHPKDLTVWLCLLMGLYQLHFLRTPDYAVVKETVGLLDRCKKTWAKGLVNAVLRSYCREETALLARLTTDKAFIQGHPTWLVQRLQQAWPNDWQAILTANDQHPPMHLRVNTLRTSTKAYLEQLQQAEIAAKEHPYAPDALHLTHPCGVHELPGFAQGDVSVQDAAAQLAVSLLALQPGQRVLDACCAPGGKTCHMLETEPNLAACVALDIEPKRLTRVQENLQRLHLKATLVQGDALTPSTWWEGEYFTRILLDAPCSATGVIRRHPDIKLLRTPADIVAIAQLQAQLLQALWPLLAPGGIFVYATCSVMPEENEQQIAQFVANTSDCECQTITAAWGRDTGHGRQILPGEENMDGFFYSVLKKVTT